MLTTGEIAAIVVGVVFFVIIVVIVYIGWTRKSSKRSALALSRPISIPQGLSHAHKESSYAHNPSQW